MQVINRTEWRALLDQYWVNDAYYQPEFADASALLEPGSKPMLLAEVGPGGATLYQAVARPIAETDLFDTVSLPQAYGGPLRLGRAPPHTPPVGSVAAFCHYHPVLRTHVGEDASEHGKVVLWDLEDRKTMHEKLDRKHRQTLSQASKNGVSTAIRVRGDVMATKTLHDAHMVALGKETLPAAYWASLRACQVAIAEARAIDGELLSGAVFLLSGNALHYHLAASSQRGRATGSATALLFEMAVWAHEAGFTTMNLYGGLNGKEDSLFDYKLKFSPTGATPAYIGKHIHDQATYSRLSGTLPTDGYFPAYRQ